jgi:hypothetical protein
MNEIRTDLILKVIRHLLGPRPPPYVRCGYNFILLFFTSKDSTLRKPKRRGNEHYLILIFVSSIRVPWIFRQSITESQKMETVWTIFGVYWV